MQDPTREELLEVCRKYIGTTNSTEDDYQFDIEAAIYWFAHDYHGGQGSNLYAVLSTSPYHPSPSNKDVIDAGDEAAILYAELERNFIR